MDKRRNQIWKNITQKTEYRVDVVMSGLTYDEALDKEKEFILLYGKICDGSGCLANVLDFGSGSLKNYSSESEMINKADRMKGNQYAKGRKWSDEQKLKMSLSRKGYKNNLGKKWSEETKNKMSQGHLGNTATKGYKWITNGVINKMIGPNDVIPNEYNYGITRLTNNKQTLKPIN